MIATSKHRGTVVPRKRLLSRLSQQVNGDSNSSHAIHVVIIVGISGNPMSFVIVKRYILQVVFRESLPSAIKMQALME